MRNVTRLIRKAHEKKEEQKAWEIWLAKYPHMTKKNFVGWEEFLRKLKTPAIKPKQTNETVQDTYNRFKQMVKRSAS